MPIVRGSPPGAAGIGLAEEGRVAGDTLAVMSGTAPGSMLVGGRVPAVIPMDNINI